MFFKNYFNPTPENQQTIGFNPNFYIKFLRFLSKIIIKILFLNGKNRFSNEFIQSLNPLDEVIFRKKKFYFRTGHGRLHWRVKTFHNEEPMMLEFLHNITNDDIFVDIGSNVGIYSVPAAYFAKKVYAFEMDLNNSQLLFENLYLNRLLDKVLIFPNALSENLETQKIFYRSFSKGDALHNVGIPSPELKGNFKGFEHNSIMFTYDFLVEKFCLEPANKIKIDVDGSERKVFEGIKQNINFFKEIYIEINDDIDENKQIYNYLEINKFKIFKIEKNKNKSHGNISMVYFKKG